jgi:hypothetical protein
MINSISVGENKINLRGDDDINIFKVDSLSLLIGINGSGKTYFLKQVVNEFRSTKTGDFTGDVRVEFKKRNGQSTYRNDAYIQWGVVYYTPVPYRPKFHQTKNFKDASGHSSRQNIFTIHEYSDIIAEFGFSPQVYIKAKANVENILRWTIEESLDRVNLKQKPYFERFSLYYIIHQNNEAISLMKVRGEVSEEIEKKVESNDKLSKELIEIIIDDLVKKISKPGVFSLFLVIDYFRKKGTLMYKDVIELLDIAGRGSSENVLSKAKSIADKIKFTDIICEFIRPLTKHIYEDWELNYPVDPFYFHEILSNKRISQFFSLEMGEMSSGQLTVINQIASITKAVQTLSRSGIKKVLLLIDEGDAFLHLEWQRKYISQLDKILSYLKVKHQLECIQVILTTHSPLLATDVPRDYICSLDKEDNVSGFSSPIHLLINQSFGSRSIGEFASEVINSVVKEIKSGVFSDKSNYVLKVMDNEILKREICRIIDENDRLNGDVK